MQKIFSPDELLTDALFQRLAEMCRGLIYSSETDAPVEAFSVRVGDRSASDVLKANFASDHGPAEVLQQEGVEFFSKATRRAEWHDQSRVERAETFREIQEMLENNLRSLAVYRVGTIDVAIFVAGLDDRGNLIGIKTRAVET